MVDVVYFNFAETFDSDSDKFICVVFYNDLISQILNKNIKNVIKMTTINTEINNY